MLPGPGVFVRTWVPRVRTGPTGSRQAAVGNGGPARPGATVTQPRGDAPRRLYGAGPPIARRLVPGTARGDEAFPPLIIVRRASTRSTSFVLAALRALHVDRAFTAGAFAPLSGKYRDVLGCLGCHGATPRGGDSATGVGNTRSSRCAANRMNATLLGPQPPRCGQPRAGGRRTRPATPRDPRRGTRCLGVGQGRPWERGPRPWSSWPFRVRRQRRFGVARRCSRRTWCRS